MVARRCAGKLTDQRFLRRERIRRKREFDRLFRDGRLFRFPEISLRALPNGLPYSRLGLSVGRKVGGAVRRNRIKRLLREAYRLNKHVLSVSCDIVVVPRPEWSNLSLGVIEPTFQKALLSIEKAFAPS